MKKILSAIGKKNIIIISGILLIGIAVYLNLTLQVGDTDIPDGYLMDNDSYYYDYEDSKVFGQAALVDNMNFDADSEDMGSGMGELGMNDADLQSGSIAEENYFAIATVSRRRARDESLELLNDIINNAEAMPDIKDKALKDIETMASEIEKEANIEVLVKAKGFIDCVAVVSGEVANIIVKTDGLMPNEVAQIKEIVYEQAGINPGNVKIVERT
ncbi:MAG: SpoIIIAH-like family protein [Oscillospiraceae bacterium]|nr:SpoIIIAH-like family protein [Oscillospiraceae bacterium]